MRKEKQITRGLLPFLLSPFPFLLVCSCRSAPPPGGPQSGSDADSAPAASATPIDSRNDADAWIGRRVTLVGRLGAWKGVHATITTPSGLVVGLPHFELAARGRPWFEQLHRPVEVTGILRPPHHAVPEGIPSFDGPTLDVESFRGLD